MLVSVSRAVVCASLLAAPCAYAQELSCRLDGRLLPAARAALSDPAPSASVVRALTEGADMRAPEVLTWRALGGDEAVRRERLRAWISSRAPSGSPRCAVVSDGARTAAALVPRLAEVRDEAADAPLRRWSVALPAGAESPQLVVAPDDGPITRIDLDATGRVSLPSRAPATLQVVLSLAGDPQVWARWREGPPAGWETPQVHDEIGVRAAINGLRRRARVDSLRPDPLAASMATQRARGLADARRVAHVIDAEGPVEALQRAQVRAGVIVEVIARGPTLSDAVGALLSSPTHRARLEEPSLRVIGVGSARADGQVYVVALLTDGTSLTAGAR